MRMPPAALPAETLARAMQALSRALDERTLLAILSVASVASTLQSGLLCAEDIEKPLFDAEPGQCGDFTLAALVICSLSSALSLGLLLAAQLRPQVLGGKLRWLELCLLPLWLSGTLTMTLHSPYYLASNGYFAAWVALASSWKLSCAHFPIGKSADEWVSSPWGILCLASLLQVVQTLLIVEEEAHTTRARITDRYGLHSIDTIRRWSSFRENSVKLLLIILGSLSFGCCSIRLGLGLASTSNEKLECFTKVASFLLLLGWSIIAGIATYDYPYRHAGNGYFSCWVAWSASAKLVPGLCSAGKAKLNEFGHNPGFPVLLACSLNVVVAAARWCAVYSCDGFTQWAVACGVISSTISLVCILIGKCKKGSEEGILLTGGLTLVVLWLVGTPCMTFHWPFKMMGNGFVAAWCALFAAVRVVKERWGWLQRLDSSWNALAIVFCASCALVLQAGLDCDERGDCEWPWVRAIMFGAVSMPVTIFAVACKHFPELKKIQRLIVAVLFVWWCAGVVCVTFASPYVLMGTAYLACWSAFCASFFLMRVHWGSLMRSKVVVLKSGEASSEVVPVEDTCDSPISLAQEYEGHFSHPDLGGGNIDVRIEVSSPRAGKWVYLGEEQDVEVEIAQRRVHFMSPDKAMSFDGIMGGGVIRGDVTRGGVSGGNFSLTPKASSIFPSALFSYNTSNNRSSANDCKVTPVTDPALMTKIQEVFDKTWQDRAYKGQHKVQKLKVVRAERVFNTKVRIEYFDEVKQVKSRADERPVARENLLTQNVDTAALAPDLDATVNEALMFHGSSPEGANAILRTRVKVIGSGTAHGDLYGPGCYFADTPCKADTYARPQGDGTCGMIISRVVLGNVFTTTAQSPDIKDLLRKINSGDYDTVCGDRRSIKGNFGGWREFITFDEQRSLPLFLVWYRRV